MGVFSALFLLYEALPGNPEQIFEDPRVSKEHVARIRQAYGLDRPLPERAIRFLGQAVRLEWGVSFSYQRPVRSVLFEALPRTLTLGSAALVLELGLGLFLGILLARRAGGPLDQAFRAVTVAVWSLPSFWLGLLLLRIFAYDLGWFPPGGTPPLLEPTQTFGRIGEEVQHLILPALALGLPAAVGYARFVRAQLLEVAGETYLLAARARGVPEHRIVFAALHAAAPPLIQLAGLSLAGLLSGAVTVEVVFGWPGLGRLAFEALSARDLPLLFGSVGLSAGMVLLASTAAELFHLLLDPRIEHPVAQEGRIF
jgi:peptide/nickel transport system permease protein